MELRPVRLAAHVSDAWNEICWKQDAEFLDLVSKLIKVPVLELRSKILLPLTKQQVAVVTEPAESYWEKVQCPAMIKEESCWKQCKNVRTLGGGRCLLHKHSIMNETLKWRTDALFTRNELFEHCVEEGEDVWKPRSV